MKFMKLGSKPDTFYNRGSDRLVASDVPSDLVIHVNGRRYLLHKFPLLSKSLHLQRLYSEAHKKTSSNPQPIVRISDFPGGAHAFEICSKFCYSITITISPRNLIPILRASQFLQMTDEGNLAQKIEAFFSSCVLRKWRDAIVTLRCTRAFPTFSEDSKITGRCISSIASMASSSKAGNGWAKDLAELGIGLYCRTMLAVSSVGKVPPFLIGDALRAYASRWLSSIYYAQEDSSERHKLILESIVRLLPPEKSAVSCSFLSKLLKAANVVRASPSTKMEVAKRVGLQLEEASVDDLLIPSLSSDKVAYDVDVFLTILEQFTSSSSSSSHSHSSRIKVAKLVDKYLQKVAEDKNLSISKFLAIAEAVPESARQDHDDLYEAIDAYLKRRPELNKKERKRLCRALDCKKLSEKACALAARNEMLPLRIIIQVMFFEQARAGNDLPTDIKALLLLSDSSSADRTMKDRAEDQWSVSGKKSSSMSGVSALKTRVKVDDGGFLDVKFPERFQKNSVIKSRPMSKKDAAAEKK